MINHRSETQIRIISIVVLWIVSLYAIAVSYQFITDPSGESLNLSVELLDHSPFFDYLIPGIILLLTIGIPGVMVAIFVMKKVPFYPHLILIQGCILFSWILLQVILLRDFIFLDFAFGLTGILLIIIGRIL